MAKWKTVLWSDESKFEVLFGKLGCHVIRTKEDKDNPSCYQRSVQKPASLMVWGCMSACGMGSLHIWKGTINAERYIQVLEQHMLPSRRRLFQGRPCIFQHDNARPHTASITTSWLRRRRIRVLKWPACSPDLSPIENIWRIIKSSGSQTFLVIPHFRQGGILKPHLPPSPQHNANEMRNKLNMFQFIELTSSIRVTSCI